MLLGVLIFLLPLLLFFGRAFDPWERAVYDAFCRTMVEEDQTSDSISLILIDTKTLEWGMDYYESYKAVTGSEGGAPEGYGADTMFLWPWKRSVYEILIHFLAQGGARVVVFDMVFDTPHPSGDLDSDLTLGYSTLLMNEEGKTFVLHTLNFRASEKPPEDPLDDLEARCLRAASITVEGIEASPFPFHRSDEDYYYDPILPYRAMVEEIVDAVEGRGGLLRLGAVSAQVDPDSMIRRARVLTRFRDWTFPSLGLAAVLAFWESHGGPGTVNLTVNGDSLVLQRAAQATPVRLPLTPSGDILVHWKDTGLESYEGEGRFKTYPAYQVLLSALEDHRFLDEMANDPKTFRVDPSEFKDRIVFIGANALGLYDLKATPISENYPGVKVHAAVVENLLEGDPIERMPLSGRAALLVGVTLLTFLATLLIRKASFQFMVTAGLMVVYVLLAMKLFTSWLLWVDTIAPLAGIVVAYTGGITYNYFKEGRHKREITRMFRHYVPADVVDQLVARPEALNTRGVRVQITVLFSDIRGFAALSNTPEMRDNPDRLTEHLNEYLTEMTEAIHACGGTLDKYIGDAVVAFFGAPLPMENHAREACRAALACQERLVPFNEQAKLKGLPEFYTRIGLFTGEAMVGNVGSKVRLSYTAIGSTVNFGARLEGVNKTYGSRILAGAPTIRMAGEAIVTRFIDLVRVPGVVDSAPPLEIYQVLAEADRFEKEQARLKIRFDEAMAAYKAGRFEEALPLFEQCRQEFDDPPSGTFVERCRGFIDNPPEAWDGVWRIESK
ncbi:MAG: CHASE2 domain-containing protein [Planctomycetota bacterium]